MIKFKSPKVERWVILFIVAFAGGIITKLPYLKDIYFTTLQSSTGTTKEQLGILLSMYGIVNFILYFPGGMIADKFSPKKLIVFSCFATALIGFWYATLPGYTSLLIIHTLFGITTVFTFWASMVKIANNLGDENEQGRIFGFLEGGRGLVGTIISLASVYVFSRFADEKFGLQGAITFYSIALIVAGILAILFISDPQPKASDKMKENANKVNWADFKEVVKIPRIWMCGLLVICNYSAVIIFGYLTPYLSEIYKVDSSTVAVLGVIRAYVLMFGGSLLAGLLADKLKSTIKFMEYGFVGMAVFSFGYLLIPVNRGMLWVLVINFVLQGLFLLGVKAMYFATIDEVHIPKKLAGTASGVISIVGYAPEIFLYTLVGSTLDNHPGIEGYHICFYTMAALSAAGFLLAIALRVMNRRYVAAHPESVNGDAA